MKYIFLSLLLIQVCISQINCYATNFHDDGLVCNHGWFWDPRCGDDKNETMFRSFVIDETSINCAYKLVNGSTLSTLTCTGLNQTITCNAFYVSTLWIELFMISANPSSVSNTIPGEEFSFSLFPARPDSNGFHESTVLGLGPWNNTYSFYFSPEKKDEGIRIEDPICAKTLLTLLTDDSKKVAKLPIFVGEEGHIEDFNVLGKLTIEWR